MIQKTWTALPMADESYLSSFPRGRIMGQLAWNRGLSKQEEAEEYFAADFEKGNHDAFLFRHMAEAVDLAIAHIKSGNKIFVYGDYDADGVTSSALLLDVLSLFKADASVYIPDRVSEGYGLNKPAIEHIASLGTKLIITVDGGIRNKEEVAFARSLGIDVILTDHHMPPEDEADLPDCLIINPSLATESYPFRHLSGVGVAFKLAKGLIDKSKLDDESKRRLEERCLDLLALGTVADCVSLSGENRVLVKKGMEVLNRTRRLGLRELIKVSGLSPDKRLDSWNIGFQLTPRLNAAGRMDHANTAFELLIAKDQAEAEILAANLNQRNIERQANTAEIMAEVEKQVAASDHEWCVIGIYDGINSPEKEEAVWNEGVVGLVAGKICEKYFRPALVVTRTENGYKGSGRSIPDFNIIKALEECADHLTRFGGHPAACGFSFAEDQKEAFLAKFREVAEKGLRDRDLRPRITYDLELPAIEISESLAESLRSLEPFGQCNEKPRFMSAGLEIVDLALIGAESRHLRLRVKNGSSRILTALAFGQAEKWRNLSIGDRVDILYHLENNEFNGRTEVQLKVIDIRLSAI